MSRSSHRSRIPSTLLWSLAVLSAAIAADAAVRPSLAGTGACAGVPGLYVAAVAGGSATVVSGAPFPGGSPSSAAAELVDAPASGLWATRVGRLPAEIEGCVGFDKDRFTWPGDLATYVQYLVRDLLAPAQRLDPAIRTLAVADRTVRLEVTRPGADRAVLAGPEGAMLGYGQLDDPERYFFLPVILGGGETLLVRIFRNRGDSFGQRATEAIGVTLVHGEDTASTATDPPFEIRRLPG